MSPLDCYLNVSLGLIQTLQLFPLLSPSQQHSIAIIIPAAMPFDFNYDFDLPTPDYCAPVAPAGELLTTHGTINSCPNMNDFDVWTDIFGPMPDEDSLLKFGTTDITEGLSYQPSLCDIGLGASGHYQEGFEDGLFETMFIAPTRFSSPSDDSSSSSSDSDYSPFLAELFTADSTQYSASGTGTGLDLGYAQADMSSLYGQGHLDADFRSQANGSSLGFDEQMKLLEFVSSPGSSIPADSAVWTTVQTRIDMPCSTSSLQTSQAPIDFSFSSESHQTQHNGSTLPTYQLGLPPEQALLGTGSRTLHNMSLDSHQDLPMSVNHDITQEQQMLQRPINDIRLGDASTSRPATDMANPPNAAARKRTKTTRTSPPPSTPKRNRRPKRASPEIRDRPFKAAPNSTKVKEYPCRFCGFPSESRKDRDRHELRHTRPDSYGWFCPGVATSEAEQCTCPELGYTRSDLLIRHLRKRGPGSACYEGAIKLRWNPVGKGSIKRLEKYRPFPYFRSSQ